MNKQRDDALDQHRSSVPEASAPRSFVAFCLRRPGRGDGRAVVCRGAVLFLVLPHHRIRRHDASRQGARRRRCPTARITVRFDSNVAAGLPWRFEPERRTIDVKLGQVVTVYYAVTNEAARVTAGQAGYNVSPSTIGIYFDKINCFCFTEQTMKPGEKRDMAVVFYVDPKLAEDSELDNFRPSRSPTRSIRCACRIRRRRRARRQSPAASDLTTESRRRFSVRAIEATKGARPQTRSRQAEKTTMADAHTPNRTTTITWSIPARGRPSAQFGLHHRFRAHPVDAPHRGLGAGDLRPRRHRHSLHDDRLVARRHPRSRSRARPYPRGADLAPLRHDAVHRLGSDVLRRLVLGLFQHRAVSGRARRTWRGSRSSAALAAEGHPHLRSLAPAAAEHADPAHLGHHGDLGASRAARERPQGPDLGPASDHRCSASPSPACRLRNMRMRRSTIRATSTAPPSSWRPAFTAPTSSSAQSS